MNNWAIYCQNKPFYRILLDYDVIIGGKNTNFVKSFSIPLAQPQSTHIPNLAHDPSITVASTTKRSNFRPNLPYYDVMIGDKSVNFVKLFSFSSWPQSTNIPNLALIHQELRLKHLL